MAKKQTRRSVSLSKCTYERLKAYCEAQSVSMSQFVEGRLGEALGKDADMPPRSDAPKATAEDIQQQVARPQTSNVITF